MSIYLIGWVARNKNNGLSSGQTSVTSLEHPPHSACVAAVKQKNPKHDKITIVSVMPISSRDYEIYTSKITIS